MEKLVSNDEICVGSSLTDNLFFIPNQYCLLMTVMKVVLFKTSRRFKVRIHSNKIIVRKKIISLKETMYFSADRK